MKEETDNTVISNCTSLVVLEKNNAKNKKSNVFGRNKKVIIICVLSVLISTTITFTSVRFVFGYQNDKVKELDDKYTSINSKINSLADSISTINKSIDFMKKEDKLNRDKSLYIYTAVADLQSSVSDIKLKLNIPFENTDDAVIKLPVDNREFIESLEKLVKSGAPFNDFIDLWSEKIDIKKYRTIDELMKYSSSHTKSIDELRRDFEIVGSLFGVQSSESFWERQKRLFKEKFINAIRIVKLNEENVITDNLTDKQIYEEASRKLSDGKLNESIGLLEKIKTNSKDLSILIQDIRKRFQINKALETFKKELITNSEAISK